MEECRLPIISEETIGVCEYSIMPRKPSLPEAILIAALISSAATSLSSYAKRSTTDPFRTGTLVAIQCNLPLSSGKTSPTAIAAPVDVGIIFSAAARLRRQSVCGTSAKL